MDDASLEEFLGDSERADGDDPADGNGPTDTEEPADGIESVDRTASEGAAGETTDSDTNTANATGETASDSDPDPTHSTYGWTPDGTACADCGATVRRRWRDDGRFVCADCKAW